jgi:GNAT superfamily N-acetyltransferase
MTNLVEMFRDHRALRAVIEAAVEGVVGDVVYDDASRPRAARLDLGCYTFFGGEPAAGERLVRGVRAPRELIAPESQRWRDLLFEVWGEGLVERPMRTYSADALDLPHLERLASSAPPGFSVDRLDAAGARELDAGLQPHALQVFADAERFVERGVGFAAWHEGHVVAASTSYAISERRVEVSISTRADFRGRGLARAVAARMLVHCLREARKVPDWSASNPISKHLAVTLGFRPAALCDVLYLDGPEARRR